MMNAKRANRKREFASLFVIDHTLTHDLGHIDEAIPVGFCARLDRDVDALFE
jgi:hypothetical protein